MNTTTTHKIARNVLDQMLAQVKQYEDAVNEWYTNGDGRPVADGGLGYVYPSCIHGMSLWTNYDNICGGCEDGGLSTWEAMAREAIWEAKRRQRVSVDRRKAILDNGLITRHDLPAELRNALLGWMVEPLEVK